MMKRPFVAAALTSAMLLVTVGASNQQAEAARRSRFKITRVRVSPTRLPGSGGRVSVTATVSAGTATVSSVTARATMTGISPTSPVTLTRSGNTWSGTVTVPANRTTRRQNAYIEVTANSSAGTATKRARVRLEAGNGGGGSGDPTQPPPPPPI
jgi:hypothetical protein